MDKISDFFKEVINRFRNPLISSYIIAWLIINWRVWIGLIFYSQSQLVLDGYKSYMDLIEKNKSPWKFFLWPLFIGLGYTFIFPVIRTWIMAFQTRINKWATNWSLEISKGGQIPMEKYLALNNSLRLRIEQVQDLINTENIVRLSNDSLHSDLLKQREQYRVLQDQVNHLTGGNEKYKSELSLLRTKNTVAIFDGTWSIKFRKGKLSQSEFAEDISISNGTSTFLSQDRPFFNIHRCAYNPITNQFLLLIEFTGDGMDYVEWNILNSKIGDTLLITENNSSIREMKKHV